MKHIYETIIITVLLSFPLFAQAGSLDNTFGGDGIITTSFDGFGAFGRKVLIQTDGKIILAGYIHTGSGSGAFALVRYNTDGTLDASFGDNGKVTTFINNTSQCYDALIQPDGKIVCTGLTWVSGLEINFALVRYNTNGSLDTDFGNQGIVITDVPSSNQEISYGIALQPDGRIISAGTSWINNNFEFTLVRYNNDGSLDTSFGTNGIVITDFGGNSSDDCRDVILQPDGKIICVGSSDFGGTLAFGLARYNDDGSLDTSFSNDGKVITNVAGSTYDIGFKAALQLDNKIVVAGYTVSSDNHDFALVRYNTDGSLDPNFGFDGIVVTDIGLFNDEANSVVIQSDGKIVAVGYAVTASEKDFAIVRYNTDGSLDTDFGNLGKVTTRISYQNDIANSVAIQSDGKLVSGGFSAPAAGNTSFAIVRYLAGNPLSVEEETANLKEFNLAQNYPNPFNPSTKIKYKIPSVGTSFMKFVQLKVYDVLGNEVATLVNEEKAPGTYEVEFNAEGLASGVYFYKLRIGDSESGSAQSFVQARKMILIK